MTLSKEAFADLARDDFEFTRETRYLDGTIKLEIGDDDWALNFKDGELVSVSDTPAGEVKVVVGGKSEHWRNFFGRSRARFSSASSPPRSRRA